MFKNYYLAAFCLLLFGCSREEEELNSIPSQFVLDELSFDGTIVNINWSEAKDADEDEVYYHVYLNSELIGGPITQNHISTNVEYNKSYEGVIIATDRNGGSVELKFTFKGPRTRIALITDWQSSQLVAIDLYTRKRKWTALTQSRINSAKNGLAFSGLGKLSAYNVLTGEKAWEAQPVKSNYEISYRHIMADDRFLFAKVSEDKLVCIDLERREKQWEVSVFDSDFRFSMDKNSLYVPKRNNYDLIKINKISGEIEWGFKLDHPVSSLAPRIEHAPLVYEGNVYFQDNNGRFYSVSKTTGVKNYSINIGRGSQTAPVGFKGNIFFSSGDLIFSVDAGTGEINWTNDLEFHSKSSPFVHDGILYVGAGEKLFAFNAATGNLQWRTNLGGEIVSSPVVYDQKVYISSHAARLYCIDTETGEIEWEEGNVEATFSSPTLVIGETEQIIHSSDYGNHD